MRLIAVRHGESTWNATGRWQGVADPDLSERGQAQAAAVAARLATIEIDAVVSSDLARALQTAAAIATPHSLEVEVRAGLRERDVGAWTGLTRAEIEERFPQQWRAYRSHLDPPIGGGESASALHRRVGTALRATVADAGSRGHSTTVIVAHGGPVRAIAYAALRLGVGVGVPLAISAPGNAALSTVVVDSRGMRLHSYNDTTHLVDVGADPTALDG